MNRGAVTVRFVGQKLVASYIEYSYIEKSARPVVRKSPEAQGTVSNEKYRHFKSKLYMIAAKKKAGEKLIDDERKFWDSSYCGELSRVATKRKAGEKLTDEKLRFWDSSYCGELSRVATKRKASEKLTDEELKFWDSSFCGTINRLAEILAAGGKLDDNEQALYAANNIIGGNAEYKRLEAKLKDGGKLDEDEQVYRDAYAKQKSSASSNRGKATVPHQHTWPKGSSNRHLSTAASTTCSLSKEDLEHAETDKQARDQFKRDLRAANIICCLHIKLHVDTDVIYLKKPKARTLWGILEAYINLCAETTQAAASMSVEKQVVDGEGARATPAAALVSPSPDKHKRKRKQSELVEPTVIAQESANPAKKKKRVRIRTEAQKDSAKRRAAELKKERSLESSVDEDKKQKLALS